MTPEELFESHKHLAKETLYKAYKLPRQLARKNQIEFEDLLQYAYTGLWKAAISFQPSKCKFPTHAINHIKWHLNERLRRECPVMKLSANVKYDENEMYRIISIDKEFVTKDSKVSLHDSISSNVNVEELAIGEYITEKVLTLLNERELKMFNMRLEGMTNQQIGDIYGMTRANVRVILLKAKVKIDRYLNDSEVV